MGSIFVSFLGLRRGSGKGGGEGEAYAEAC